MKNFKRRAIRRNLLFDASRTNERTCGYNLCDSLLHVTDLDLAIKTLRDPNISCPVGAHVSCLRVLIAQLQHLNFVLLQNNLCQNEGVHVMSKIK